MNSDKDDGGSAFPEIDRRGMSLRDWFAGQALAGMMQEGFMPNQVHKTNQNTRDWNYATAAYAMADAMLKERVKPCHE